jgi:uncharacterized repeat protein (TIGR01451 family)
MILLLCVAFCFGVGEAVSDLSIIIEEPGVVVVGGAATYMVNLFNLGPSTASGVIVTISPDPSASFISSSGAICSLVGSQVRCLIGIVNAVASSTIRVVLAYPRSLVNSLTTAHVSASGDPNPFNNDSTNVIFVVPCPVCGSAVSSSTVVPASGQFRVNFQFRNAQSFDDALSFSVASATPAQLTLVDASFFVMSARKRASVSCPISGGDFACSIGTLPPGGVVDVSAVYQVSPSANGYLTVCADRVSSIGRITVCASALASNCSVCGPSQSLVAPCGVAFHDWLGSAGFAQTTGLCSGTFNLLSGLDCRGSSASTVRSTYNFSLVSPSDLGVATFATADGSCSCNYCYMFEDFDTVSSASPCWSLSSSSAFALNSTIFDSPPSSLGSANIESLTPGTYWMETQTYHFFKTSFTFWLRTSFANGETLALQRSTDDGATYMDVSFSGCLSSSLWTGSQTCVVSVSVPMSACTVSGATSIPIRWRWTLTIPSSPNKRVEAPTVPTFPALPPRGFWIDSIKSCGETFQCS